MQFQHNNLLSMWYKCMHVFALFGKAAASNFYWSPLSQFLDGACHQDRRRGTRAMPESSRRRSCGAALTIGGAVYGVTEHVSADLAHYLVRRFSR